MPILSNNYREVFRGDAVHRILTNPFKRQRLINDLIKLLKEYEFAGVNVDFEELQETSDEMLVGFQKELYEKLHAQNFLVTQDVIPFNEDYNFKALSKYNDYLILMAYDEHHTETKAGPICSQRWIQAALDKMDNQVAPEKIILGMAGYGYDWKQKSKKVVSFSTSRRLRMPARVMRWSILTTIRITCPIATTTAMIHCMKCISLMQLPISIRCALLPNTGWQAPPCGAWAVKTAGYGISITVP
jgi:hypothetical protein